jgi:hypothetical protein
MRLAGMNKGVDPPWRRTIDEVSRSRNLQSKATKFDTELKVVLFYSTNYRNNLFIFCKAGVIQMARLLFKLIYGTWEATYNCQGKCMIQFPTGEAKYRYCMQRQTHS